MNDMTYKVYFVIICLIHDTISNPTLKILEKEIYRFPRDITSNKIFPENQCGERFESISQPLIVLGKDAKYGEFPWHVGIYKKEDEDPSPVYICGGSIISKNSILTAAHCFTYGDGSKFEISEFYVAAGKYYSNYDSQNDTVAQKRLVSNIIVHPQYKGILSNYAWDIAIVEIKEPFEISDLVQPVCIDLSADIEDESMKTSDYGYIAGWGFTEKNLNETSYEPSAELKVLNIPYIEHNKCSEELPKDTLTYLTPDKFCAGYKNGSSVCIGDSGNGLVFKKTEKTETRYFIRGLVSVGVIKNEFCDNYQYSTYTRISDHLSFIQNHIQNACTTPNGELAKCISLYNCKVFVNALTSNTTTPEMHRFIVNSQCGYIEAPLVCCGTVAQYQNNNNETVKVVTRNKYFEHKNYNLLPSRDVCGKQEFQYNSIGGNIAGLDEFPWVARLWYERSEVPFYCSGVLINERYVLTASDCILRTAVHQFRVFRKVWLGEYNSKTSIDCINRTDITGQSFYEDCADKVLVIEPEEIIFNKDFRTINETGFQNYSRTVNQRNDIGLLRLPQAVTYTRFIRPICLPFFGETTPPGKDVIITGWQVFEVNGGLVPYKLKATTPIIDFEECNNYYIKNRRYSILESQICAGGKGGADSCEGDGGGPAMNYLPNSTQFYIEGIVTFGTGNRECGIAGEPRLYTRVSDFLDWILDHLEP